MRSSRLLARCWARQLPCRTTWVPEATTADNTEEARPSTGDHPRGACRPVSTSPSLPRPARAGRWTLLPRRWTRRRQPNLARDLRERPPRRRDQQDLGQPEGQHLLRPRSPGSLPGELPAHRHPESHPRAREAHQLKLFRRRHPPPSERVPLHASGVEVLHGSVAPRRVHEGVGEQAARAACGVGLRARASLGRAA